MSFYFISRAPKGPLRGCSDKSLYAGFCVDLQNRERAHNEGKGAKYTRSRRPVEIVYSEEFPSRSAAMQREAQVKKWPKTKKEHLICPSATNI
ncbi:MAG: GIY-YIG nuclease family protein [Candidatus Peribacteraceae bacterium]|nr:GIY-YIG nuclease family protein [Candidatus Peribacteraceae bacterium]